MEERVLQSKEVLEYLISQYDKGDWQELIELADLNEMKKAYEKTEIHQIVAKIKFHRNKYFAHSDPIINAGGQGKEDNCIVFLTTER